MTGTPQQATLTARPRGLWLLIAVLAGLFAMHGLAPGPAPGATADSHGRPAASPAHGAAAPQATHGAAARQAEHGCAHDAGAGAPGRMNHADATCAAVGTGSSYAPPALTRVLDTAGAAAVAPPIGISAATDGGRAPPDLAELQLLRI